jgi:hypothetical protein
LAGKSTLNRLELSRAEPIRYAKIAADTDAIEALLVDLFRDAHAKPPRQITLDLDATGDPLHGHQEGRFFHGYYERLAAAIATELAAARAEAQSADKPARRFKDFRRSTRDSRSRTRRVIGKAQWTQGEANPRFIVTSLTAKACDGRQLYETIYCARGAMENRIKACQLDLFADRTSAATMQANQLRLWFASLAYVLLCALRQIGLAHTQFADATSGTIRLKLLKIGAWVKISVPRVAIAMASACPWQQEFALAPAMLWRASA